MLIATKWMWMFTTDSLGNCYTIYLGFPSLANLGNRFIDRYNRRNYWVGGIFFGKFTQHLWTTSPCTAAVAMYTWYKHVSLKVFCRLCLVQNANVLTVHMLPVARNVQTGNFVIQVDILKLLFLNLPCPGWSTSYSKWTAWLALTHNISSWS